MSDERGSGRFQSFLGIKQTHSGVLGIVDWVKHAVILVLLFVMIGLVALTTLQLVIAFFNDVASHLVDFSVTGALLNDGILEGRQVIPAALIARFFQPQGTLGSRAGLEVGYGAGVYGWVRHGQLFHGHGGDADGYRSRYGLLREHGRAYLLVINSDNPALLGRMRRALERALTTGLPAPDGPQPGSDDLLGRIFADFCIGK